MPTHHPPQHCPTPRELDDLELLASGALAPTTAFDEPGSPVTLTLPAEVASATAEAGEVELVDPEGLPLARVTVPGGAVTPLTHPQYGPFRRLYLTPAQVREQYAGRTVVPVVDALTETEIEVLGSAGPVLLLALVGHGTPELSATGLIRATLAAAALMPDAAVVAVPLASHGDAEVDHALGVRVVANYAGPDRVIGVPDASVVEQRAPASVVETPAPDRSPYPPEIASIVDADRPPRDRQGLVLFFTGLSGSGKSTLARALMDRILEHGSRTVTSLDGDVVRRNLSAGLTFSKEDRETNIRRIGWVAAEISRHGGLAVCSPIAPFDETRQQVRAMVDDAGGAFFLVHVATPLEECERRDRKGLYAKARRGEIPEFTGISSPYEEPQDADVRVDTTGRTIDDALGDVIDALKEAGYLDLTAPVVGGFEAQAPGRLRTSTTGTSVVETPETNAGPLRVLYVCTANICRSPFMELLSRHLAGPDPGVTFASAGTHGFRESEMDPVMAGTLPSRGVDAGKAAAFRSRPFSPAMLRDHDLVLTAESAHRQFILDDHPEAFRKVFTLGQFAASLAAGDTDLTGRDLLAAVAGQRRAADVELDVIDPYRRGPEAAEAAAQAIERLLRAVVPALAGSRKALT